MAQLQSGNGVCITQRTAGSESAHLKVSFLALGAAIALFRL